MIRSLHGRDPLCPRKAFTMNFLEEAKKILNNELTSDHKSKHLSRLDLIKSYEFIKQNHTETFCIGVLDKTHQHNIFNQEDYLFARIGGLMCTISAQYLANFAETVDFIYQEHGYCYDNEGYLKDYDKKLALSNTSQKICKLWIDNGFSSDKILKEY